MFYFHPIRSKEPSIFNFPTLDSAKYFYTMAVTAGPKVLPSKLDWFPSTIEAFWEKIGRLWIFQCALESCVKVRNCSFLAIY